MEQVRMDGDDFRSAEQNPYRAPASTGVAETRDITQPTAVTVFGILNLLYGLMGLCGAGFGTFALFFTNSFQPPGAPPNPAVDSSGLGVSASSDPSTDRSLWSAATCRRFPFHRIGGIT
ncbi:MAG: hypothetical protein R3C19_22925 [Planctomycetaceae bacterium]